MVLFAKNVNSNISSCFASPSGFFLAPIPQELIQGCEFDSLAISVQILLVYFVLMYNNFLLKTKMDDKAKASITTVAWKEYNSEFVENLPIKRLFSHVEKFSHKYEALYVPFSSAIMAQFPQLFGIASLLLEEELNSR
jgi:hypothetical protein